MRGSLFSGKTEETWKSLAKDLTTRNFLNFFEQAFSHHSYGGLVLIGLILHLNILTSSHGAILNFEMIEKFLKITCEKVYLLEKLSWRSGSSPKMNL